jgi:hypothetical protein
MYRPTLVCSILLVTLSAEGSSADPPFVPQTRVAIDGTQWMINGSVTHRGAAAEGLLLNIRMVNATFEDRLKPEFDPAANTSAFLKALPDYLDHGVQAITLCLQGGMPGYEGAVNSAFDPDGSLRPEYMDRVARVIEGCDRQGCVVILGCFYQRQDQRLADEAAVRTGVVNVATWIKDRGYTNVVLEIANEYPHRGFDHELLRSSAGEAELIGLARRTNPNLLVSASGYGDGAVGREVSEAADFLLIHFNGTPVAKIPERIAALRSFGKPIVCNEDDKLGETAAAALEASIRNAASWGFMHERANQRFPFRFAGSDDDPIVYKALQRLSSPDSKTSSR